MPNGQNILDEMDFKQRMKEMPDRELLEFVADKVFKQSQLCPLHEKRISDLENRDKKIVGITGGIGGGIGGTIGAIIAWLISYFMRGSG